MKKILFTFFILTSLNSNSQSLNFRAQGKYYTAKENYESRNYDDAIKAINESKELLGGSNYQLQYLHVMAAYKAGKYKEAQIEMNRYFNILDRKEQPKGFSKTVEELTYDETKELTKLIDPIDSNVANQIKEKKRKEEEESKIAEAVKHFKLINCDNDDCLAGTIWVNGKVKCYCDGKGYVIYLNNRYTCKYCKGTGKRDEKVRANCSSCKGKGEIYKYDGDVYLSDYEIEEILRNHKKEIDYYIKN
ncbi:hypothetical protein [Meridianimaribacter flavus]|nr:hypothetical protein [Meridianimaribacter flavus]